MFRPLLLLFPAVAIIQAGQPYDELEVQIKKGTGREFVVKGINVFPSKDGDMVIFIRVQPKLGLDLKEGEPISKFFDPLVIGFERVWPIFEKWSKFCPNEPGCDFS